MGGKLGSPERFWVLEGGFLVFCFGGGFWFLVLGRFFGFRFWERFLGLGDRFLCFGVRILSFEGRFFGFRSDFSKIDFSKRVFETRFQKYFFG